jgi:aldose 1-epimerase
VSRTAFGTLPDGSAVEAVTLSAGNGVQARIITLGAAIPGVRGR